MASGPRQQIIQSIPVQEIPPRVTGGFPDRKSATIRCVCWPYYWNSQGLTDDYIDNFVAAHDRCGNTCLYPEQPQNHSNYGCGLKSGHSYPNYSVPVPNDISSRPPDYPGHDNSHNQTQHRNSDEDATPTIEEEHNFDTTNDNDAAQALAQQQAAERDAAARRENERLENERAENERRERERRAQETRDLDNELNQRLNEMGGPSNRQPLLGNAPNSIFSQQPRAQSTRDNNNGGYNNHFHND